MPDSVTVLIVAGIIIPIVFLLIYAGFRNFFTSARNPKDAVRVQSGQRQAAGTVPELVMAEFQAQGKRSDDAHKARIRAPHAGFPINWKTARILRRFVEAYHREETEDAANCLKALGEVADDRGRGRNEGSLRAPAPTWTGHGARLDRRGDGPAAVLDHARRPDRSTVRKHRAHDRSLLRVATSKGDPRAV